VVSAVISTFSSAMVLVGVVFLRAAMINSTTFPQLSHAVQA
jgi:hypothetical protein